MEVCGSSKWECKILEIQDIFDFFKATFCQFHRNLSLGISQDEDKKHTHFTMFFVSPRLSVGGKSYVIWLSFCQSVCLSVCHNENSLSGHQTEILRAVVYRHKSFSIDGKSYCLLYFCN